MHNFKIGFNFENTFVNQNNILDVFNDKTPKAIFFVLIDFYVQWQRARCAEF